jgi:tetratricopeptide (TPR) repeat protein
MPGADGEIRTTVRAVYERAIALHRAGQIETAAEIYRQLLAQRPRHAGSLHHLGVIAHQRGHHGEADRLIRAALEIEPGDTDAWSNLGLVLRAQDRLEEARACLEQALQIAPQNPSARKNLVVVLGQLARPLCEAERWSEAIPLLQRAHTLEPDSAEILNQLALCFLATSGGLPEALGHFEKARALAPEDALLLNNCGVAFKRAGRLREAAEVLRQAQAVQPDDVATLTNLGDVLTSLGETEEAVTLLQRAVALSPECAEAHNNLGVALGELEKSGEAIEHFQHALTIQPRYAPAHHNLGNQLISRGRVEEGLEHLRTTTGLDPGCVAAWYGLAITGRHVFSVEEIGKIEALLALPALPLTDQSLLHFALAHAFDRSGSPERAFAHATRANALRRASDHARGLGYDRTGHTALVDALIAFFTPEFFATHAAAGVADELPVFVTGMPRSGTTLVEQILCSHPRIHGAGELNDVSRLAFGLPGGYPHALGHLGVDPLRERAAAHLDRLRTLGGDAPRVVDKMTINFLHLGLLALLFPKARFIHLRREPRDVALSCFFHNFASPGLHFAFDLGDLAHFHREHDRIMAHWRKVLPSPIFEIEYENLVAHPEESSRALIEFCGLDWDERCLRFDRNERRVKTASALQVREPIYTRSVARWRRYEKELAPFSAGEMRPHGAAEWKVEAIAHARAGRWVEALSALDCAIAIEPSDARSYNNRGVIFTELGRDDEAIAAYREAIRIEPSLAKAHSDLGLVFYRRRRQAEARAAFDEALRHEPACADALHNRGLLRTDLGELEDGAEDLARAVKLNPSNAETWNTLGATLQVLGRVDEAMSHYDRALALAPEHVMAHYNRACALLLRGDFARGWPEHEWRLRRPDLRSVRLDAPRWDGSPCGTVLLIAEQGLGDTLQFIRYAPVVRQRAKRVVLVVQPALIALLRQAPGIDEIVPKGGSLPPFDAYVPLLSLPHLFATHADTIPASTPYLTIDSGLVAKWQTRIDADGLRVGLNWQGNPQFQRDFLRSIPLRAFAPVAEVPGVKLHSLHLGPGLAQIVECGFPIVPLSAQFDESLGTFVDTAAAMQALDLVITSDTSLAHLAGALGVPVWVLLSANPDWRWREEGDRSAWYPSMRLFRQETLRDWTTPVVAAVKALRSFQSRRSGLAI